MGPGPGLDARSAPCRELIETEGHDLVMIPTHVTLLYGHMPLSTVQKGVSWSRGGPPLSSENRRTMYRVYSVIVRSLSLIHISEPTRPY